MSTLENGQSHAVDKAREHKTGPNKSANSRNRPAHSGLTHATAQKHEALRRLAGKAGQMAKETCVVFVGLLLGFGWVVVVFGCDGSEARTLKEAVDIQTKCMVVADLWF